MTELTNIEEYLKRQNELLDRLTQINNEDYRTKKEVIGQLIDATRPLVESGYYKWPKKHFASFIYQQLEQYDIEYPRGETFYSLFHEHEVGEYGTNFNSLEVNIHEHKFSDDDVGKCQCGAIQFEALIYDVEPPKEKEPPLVTSDTISKEEKPDPFSNPYTEYLQRIKFNCDELGSICSDWVKKYYLDKDTAKAIEQSLKPNVEEQKTLEAKLIHMGKQSDFRQKIGEFEKIKSIILCESTYNLAKVAKMLSITPKHQSHNILKSLDKYLSNMKWFRSLVFECRKCQAENVIELADWYNEQVERKTLGLDMIKP